MNTYMNKHILFDQVFRFSSYFSENLKFFEDNIILDFLLCLHGI